MSLSSLREADRRIPHVVRLASCVFPLVETTVHDYRVLVLPPGLRALFSEGAHCVRINSQELAGSIPDFGGKASGNYSLLPHQDHFGDTSDPRRYLMLSKHHKGARGSSTLVFLPDVALRIYSFVEHAFKERRIQCGSEREYDSRFVISEAQYHRCFDRETGYEEVAEEVLQGRPVHDRLNLLGYLIRGSYADTVMERIAALVGAECYIERWEKPGVVILDNARVFHARLGGNEPPLQRNFCV